MAILVGPLSVLWLVRFAPSQTRHRKLRSGLSVIGQNATTVQVQEGVLVFLRNRVSSVQSPVGREKQPCMVAKSLDDCSLLTCAALEKVGRVIRDSCALDLSLIRLS